MSSGDVGAVCTAGAALVRRLTSLLAVAGVLAAVLATASAQQTRAQSPMAVAFRTSSGKIGCIYTTDPTFLRCDTTFRTRFSGHRCAEGVYGPAFGMRRSGRARALCVSDTAIEPRAPVLANGKSRRLGPYLCTSRSSGLTCANRAGHGWTLSPRRQKLF